MSPGTAVGAGATRRGDEGQRPARRALRTGRREWTPGPPGSKRGNGGGDAPWQRCCAAVHGIDLTRWSTGRSCGLGSLGDVLAHRHAFWSAWRSEPIQLSRLSRTNQLHTFSRLRPVHVNGVIFGAFSTLFIGECYSGSRLCGVPVRGEDGASARWVWNSASTAGSCPLSLGDNDGLEAGEFLIYTKIPSSS